jgi:hypothetical protein
MARNWTREDRVRSTILDAAALRPEATAAELADLVGARLGSRPASATVQRVLADHAEAQAALEHRRRERRNACARVGQAHTAIIMSAIRDAARRTGLTAAQVALIASRTYTFDRED